MSLACFWDSIKQDLKLLKSAPPGRRFRDFRRCKEERSRKRTLLAKSASIGMGGFLVVVGLSVGWLPGPGGILAIVGLALLIPHIRGMARLMDQIEVLIRKFAKALLRVWQS